jgi:RNA polymerase sigma-70 factor (ECF subfamily)
MCAEALCKGRAGSGLAAGWEVLALAVRAMPGSGCVWPDARAADAVEAERSEAERRRAFEQEALVHLDILYNTAVQMTRNAADAQDLVQETFVKAFRFFDRFTPGTNCKAWLFRIMKNSFINAFRKRSREPVRVDFNEIEPTLRARPESNGGPRRSVGGGLDALDDLVEDDVKEALDKLPFEFRMVTVLCDIEGLSYQEIADIMDCPIGTVRSRLSRARRFLQKRLEGFARERGILKAEG